MGKLEITSETGSNGLILKLDGTIDEDVSFPDNTEFKSSNEIRVDLEKVHSINSCGIREWIRWFQDFSGVHLVFFNCPKVIIDQVNMVEGFLPQGSTVESFYVPFYGEASDLEKDILFVRGTHFNDGEILVEEVIKDQESGEEIEMDVMPKKYFKFLKL